jgi:hypothetical protein
MERRADTPCLTHDKYPQWGESGHIGDPLYGSIVPI